MRTWLVIALTLACAPDRKTFGQLAVKPLHELYASTAVVHEAVFRVEKARLVAAGATAGGEFDLVAMDDGCLRGDVRGGHVQVCPDSPIKGDPPGLYRWRSAGNDTGAFSTQLLDLGDRLRVEALYINVELRIPEGAVGDEVRRHPELLGAAFAFGLFPSSSDSKELWIYEATPR